MTQGTAIAKKIYANGLIKFEVKAGDTTDQVTVDPIKDEIPGLDHLANCQVGDDFFVTVEIIPPRTSTLTHLQILSIDGPARERSSQFSGFRCRE